VKTCILVPAFNCSDTIAEVCRRIRLTGPEDEILVVDDGSSDGTLEIAQGLPRVHAVRNDVNLGYGGTSNRLYALARERCADVTVNVHGDLGHRPEEIPLILDEMKRTEADVVVGTRLLFLKNIARQKGYPRLLLDDHLRCGMPRERFLGHLVLTSLQNFVYGSKLHSFHEGMRACGRRAIGWAASRRLPSRYTYDSEFLFQAHRQGFVIREVPVPPSYDPRAKAAAPPIRYGLNVLQHVARVVLKGS
jgi:glycosyltransferase involved in cell wall biosynthesis